MLFKVSTANKLEMRFELFQRTLVKYIASFRKLIFLKNLAVVFKLLLAIFEALSGPINMT